MNLSETITSAIVAMASLSLPVILGFLLYSTLHIRKDLNKDIQGLRKDLNKDIQDLRKDLNNDMQSLRTDLDKDIQDLRKVLHQDISAINSRLGRIEGRLFGADSPTPG